MRNILLSACILILLTTEGNAAGVGKVWRVLPSSKPDFDHTSWPRSDSSAFEIRTVTGVGHLAPSEDTEAPKKPSKPNDLDPDEARFLEPNESSKKEDSNESPSNEVHDNYPEDLAPETEEIDFLMPPERLFKARVMMNVLQPYAEERSELPERKIIPRVRREAENETKMEKIATVKNVREARLNSPETWSSQPISVEFRHRASLDQVLQHQDDDEDPATSVRGHQAPRVDFVTSHYRRHYGENREARDMPIGRGYDDYEAPWYRNAIRDRDYEFPAYRRAYGYHYPDRYRMERDYYMRLPNEPSYYYDRYRDDDLDLYGRSRPPTPKPKRIIYYATLPEIVRKPVDLRNYPRPYDGLMRTPVSRDTVYKRVPGNVDPSRYRYRNLYDGYDSYTKRSSFLDRSYGYQDEESRRKGLVKENLRDNEGYDANNNERKMTNQISTRDEGKLPWPVQIGTEVNVKDDERIPGRKIFGENSGYERFQSAQLQKAPDATGSSELQGDN